MHIRESKHLCLGYGGGVVIVVSISDLLPCLLDFHTSLARCFAFASREVVCGDVGVNAIEGGVCGQGDGAHLAGDLLCEGELISRRFGDIPRRSLILSKLVTFESDGIVLLWP